MKVEVVFTGLCSFLNVRDNHGNDMVEPSIILVRTDVDVDAGTPGAGYVEGRNPEDEEAVARPHEHEHAVEEYKHEHVAFIAYNEDEVTTTSPGFEKIEGADGFWMLPLPMGVEIVLTGIPAGKPTVVQSYDTIAKKDHYWPDAKNQWNRDYVPVKGEKPDSDAVAAFMRFGQGFIGGGRLCPLEWTFQDSVGRVLTNQFAEEGFYSFDQEDGDIIVQLIDLDDPENVKEICFTPKPDDKNAIPDQILFIGNNVKDDIARCVLRSESNSYQDGDHFRFLNAVSSMSGGPFPAFGRRVTSAPSGGGGGTSGACGPHSGNG